MLSTSIIHSAWFIHYRGPPAGRDRRAGRPALWHRVGPFTGAVGVRCWDNCAAEVPAETRDFAPAGLKVDASGSICV